VVGRFRPSFPAIIAALLASSAALADNGVGKWLSPSADNWPLIAIHAVVTPDGRVLSYGTDLNGTQTGYFKYDIWDPAAGLSGGHITLDNFTNTDLFCSSQVILPSSGSILISGGDNWTGSGTTNTGNNNSNIFDYTNDSLSRGNNMNRARWYSSTTVLMNGEVYIQGGNGGGDRPEVRQLNGSFRLLSNVNTTPYASQFPRNFLARDGRVFGYDSNGVMYFVNPSGTGQLATAGTIPSQYVGWTSAAAMYQPGKILQMGGNSNNAVIVDITGAQPTVTVSAPMATRRQWVSATVIADGRVVATGGSSVENQLTGVNNTAAIWNPSGGAWTIGPSGSRARLYHSGALLLPDASVLVTGGGAPGPGGLKQLHSEIYYPPYLLDANGNFLPRPVIQTAPDTIDSGQVFTIGVGSAAIQRVTMVKTSSITHSVNMDQRFVELAFTDSSGTLFVQPPANPNDLPPGYYLLFAINSQGVPSVAKIVRMSILGSGPPSDSTATIGGGGGAPFVLTCNSNETLVGVYGNSAGTYVNRAGARCVAFDDAGRWIGTPVNRGAAGGTSGTVYTKTCPQDRAVSGFKGRSSQFVDQLDIECKAITTGGKVTGSGQFLGPVGGTGGTPQGPFSCSTGNPAYALTGRSGSLIDAFGMLCRQAPLTPTQTNTPPNVTNPGNQTGTVGTAVNLQVVASDPDVGDTLTYSATGLPAGLGISPTTGLISGVPTTASLYGVTVSVSDGTSTTNASFSWTIGVADPLVLDPMPEQPPRTVGTPITYTASSHNGINTVYKWFFDDGSETGWSSSPSVTHAFQQPTIYWVAVTAKDDRGIEQTQTFSQLIHRPLTSVRPATSGQVALGGGRLWVVNQDNDSVSAFNVATNAKLAEINVGTAPRSVAIAPSGQVWVANRRSATISIIDPATFQVTQTISLPRGSEPYGLVFSPSGSQAFVALEATGRILRLDPVSAAVTGNASLGGSPRHLSVTADGAHLYVSHFITAPLPGEHTANVTTVVNNVQQGGKVSVLDTATLGVAASIVLRHSDELDFENQGSGVPNYLGAPTISPDGTSAWVPSKQDNIKRGTLRSGANLNFQNTVRAISSRIDLATNAEQYGSRVDHDNASLASSAAFDRYGVFLFVALETSREVAVIDAHNHVEFFRIQVGRAPQALAVSDDGLTLYVSNFMDRTVGVYDVSALVNQGQWSAPLVATLNPVGTEKLSTTVLKGKQFFYDARDARLAREAYMSCATCHNDGGHDGRVWDLTGLGEGLRNTVSLRGRAGAQGFLHWTANFDEVQDFEGQIRTLAGGTGLMTNTAFNAGTRSQPLGDPKAGVSADLDALAAYVASLNAFDNSPHRNNDGSLTSDGAAGRDVFEANGCASCHGGTAFTNSASINLQDVGTIKQPTSGTRLGATLTGLDIPTLRDVWATAPYLHDGSAASLGAAVAAHSGVTVSGADLDSLVGYLQQIDGSEPPPAGTPPGGTLLRIDAGTTAPFVDSQGRTWQADFGFNASNTSFKAAAISGTVDDVLYHTVRYDPPGGPELLYSLPVANGTYTVRLHFAEKYAGAFTVGARVFDVDIEGVRAFDDVDIFAAVGARAAYVREATATVSDGSLHIQFRRQVGDPNICAIEVIPLSGGTDTAPPSVPANLRTTNVTDSQVDLAWDASTDPAPGSGVAAYEVFVDGVSAGTVSTTSFSAAGLAANTTYSFTVRAIDGLGNLSAQSNPLSVTTNPSTGGAALRIDTGATAPVTDSQGRTWQADFGFNASNTSFKADAISGTVEDVLYHSVRYDPAAAPELLYTLPVSNGTYTVRLHFVEKYSGAFSVGARVFDIDIEGSRVFEDIDIFAAVGARAAYVREATATVSDGSLHIQFRRQVGDPNICAIEVIPAGGG